MSDYIEKIESLIKSINALVFQDNKELDVILKRSKMYIDNAFEHDIVKRYNYIRDLGKIEFTPNGTPPIKQYIEDTWNTGKYQLANLLVVIVEDIKYHKKQEQDSKKTSPVATATLIPIVKGHTPPPAAQPMVQYVGTPLPSDKLFIPHSTVGDIDTQSVFVVHGHDEGAKDKLALKLKEIGLIPVILNEKIGGNKTIIEKLELYSMVQYAIIILTPDDLLFTMQDKTTTPGARQNVVFEWGYFIGKLGRPKVWALMKGSVSVMSDLAGVEYIPMDGGNGWVVRVAKELKAAGALVNLDGLFS